MPFSLADILNLVGSLDDSPGDNTARERFRTFLAKSVTTVGALRDYVETCLRTSGTQHHRALQDLVNHCGRLLGFRVEFGRYQGVAGEPGHDGLWESPAGFFIVVEVKTTDTYAIQTKTLVSYVDDLISSRRIPDWDHALGLYVVGRADASLSQITSAIIAEKRTHQLRIVSTDSLLSLAELMETYDVTHEEVLALLRPVGPVVDHMVQLIARVASEEEAEAPVEPPGTGTPPGVAPAAEQAETERLFLLTPVANEAEASAEATIRSLLDQGCYVFGDRTPGRKRLKSGDQLCFYQTGLGVVAEATVASTPERKIIKFVRHPDRFPWAFRVKDVRYFFDKPVVIDAPLRARLDAFKGRDPNTAWAWFVQATRRVTEHDLDVLVGRK